MSYHKSDLLSRISSRTATVGVIGLGYVGLPLALVFRNPEGGETNSARSAS